MGRDMHVPNGEALACLQGHGFVKETNSSFYTLTDKAMSTGLLLPVQLTQKGSLASFCRGDIPQERMSALELMGLLLSGNWSQESDGRKLKPVTKTSRKKAFYVGGDKAPSKLYMRALLDSKRLLDAKLGALHHQQLEAYPDLCTRQDCLLLPT